jgi:tetratricopeptide (TPR) repeat protein
MMRFLRWLTVLPFLGGSAYSLPTDQPPSTKATQAEFESANKFYERSDFKSAAAAYQKLVDRGVESPAVYFNLGNAWYKAEQNGRAIAAYLNAERLAPRDPNVRYNLGFVRSKVTVGNVSTGTIVQRALRHLSINEWTMLAAGAVWIALLLLASTEFRPAWRLSLRSYLIIAWLGALVLTALTTAAIYDRNHVRPAVVIVPDAVVRYGPLEESKPFYNLKDGAEVRLLQEQPQNPWAKIEDFAGRQGWLKRDQIVTVARATGPKRH